MRIALANTPYRPNSPLGGYAHMKQFIENAVALGHEILSWPNNQHPLVKRIKTGRYFPFREVRTCDVMYVRVEEYFPSFGRYATGWRRTLMGDPLVVWEFNTVPEYGLLKGRTQAQVAQAVAGFRQYGAGCDLAVCVSSHLAQYVHEQLGIAHTLVVPNGSDPELFRPDVPPHARLAKKPGQINVLWMGSAEITWHNIDLLRRTSLTVNARGAEDRVAFHIIGQGLGCMRDMPANVHYQGTEEYSYLPAWLSGMDVGLVLYRPGPADYSSPLKLFDYMASGLAVAGVEQPQLREVFSELDQTDQLVSPDDADKLADHLIALADNPEKLAERKSASRKLAVQRYSWKRAVQDTFVEIDRLLAKVPPKHVPTPTGAAVPSKV